MVNRGFGPDDRRQKDAQDGVTQEHASADVEMINTEFDPTQFPDIPPRSPCLSSDAAALDVGSRAVDSGAHLSISKPSLDCSWGRFQISKVKHQDTTFGSGKEIGVPWSIGLLWDWKAGFSGRGTRVLKVHIKVQTYSAQEPLADGCGEQGTTIAESNTARELSKINMRLDQQREDIDENNAMIAYIGNAQYTFESTLDRFEDQLDDHCLNCNQKPEKISDNSNELSFTARVKVARSLHQNKGQEGMRETNAALASENAMLKEQVEKLTSTVADLMGRFAKLQSTVHCKEAERKLGELEV
ncbi:uncharacterized protein FSUBG_4878 [Fusarium subglutinans]|uniref:Uncharacterized protein n=1 Tax=Gibberella subglutinans TaxID=42677 RepID=A0A8H5Q4E7_GIBSU|nr:uncharacterized protein FSUBG_4878 [Fusarium subglutinans]KAF5608054.1 hypothetical protein FSUBG_4878 [Fusarium subglutinans]